jgi:hypothetical protein
VMNWWGPAAALVNRNMFTLVSSWCEDLAFRNRRAAVSLLADEQVCIFFILLSRAVRGRLQRRRQRAQHMGQVHSHPRSGRLCLSCLW